MPTYLNLLKEMFQEVTVKKNAALIPHYYHKDFLLFTNEQQMDFATFLSSHEVYYKTPITYTCAYDEETFVAQGEKVAGRMWITTQLPNESAKKIEVMLIVSYKDHKIYRLWELTYPDWSTLSAFS